MMEAVGTNIRGEAGKGINPIDGVLEYTYR
jgi:hypothetical protein